jgi:hypothetical protein
MFNAAYYLTLSSDSVNVEDVEQRIMFVLSTSCLNICETGAIN